MSVSHGHSTIGGREYGGCGEEKKEAIKKRKGPNKKIKKIKK